MSACWPVATWAVCNAAVRGVVWSKRSPVSCHTTVRNVCGCAHCHVPKLRFRGPAFGYHTCVICDPTSGSGAATSNVSCDPSALTTATAAVPHVLLERLYSKQHRISGGVGNRWQVHRLAQGGGDYRCTVDEADLTGGAVCENGAGRFLRGGRPVPAARKDPEGERKP
jgi:hypothetical protein